VHKKKTRIALFIAFSIEKWKGKSNENMTGIVYPEIRLHLAKARCKRQKAQFFKSCGHVVDCNSL